MRNIRHYTPQLSSDDNMITLEGDSAHYIGKVLRARLGQICHFFNGKDHYEYIFELTEVSKNFLVFTKKDRRLISNHSPLNIHIAQSLGKGDRIDIVIQKATELGATSITPIISERVDFKIPKEREAKRIDSWQKIAINASEQSGRVTVPKIQPITDYEDFIANCQSDLKLILSPIAKASLHDLRAQKPTSVTMIIGPEGGLSDIEITKAVQQHFTAIRLGPRILRTETAPIALCSIINHLWGDI